MGRFGRVWRAAAGAALCAALLLCAPPRAALAAAPPPGNGFTGPAVEAGAYLVMDAGSGQVLVSGSAQSAEYPASITKILTVGLVLERVDLAERGDETVSVSHAAVDALIPRATMVALIPGEAVRLRDLVYATYVESANDAAHVLAEYISGSMAAFAELMNEKAAELGLEGSFFANPSGQPDPRHVTTAYDMAVITRWALSVPGFREVFSTVRYEMPPTNLQPAGRTFNNANLMLHGYSAYYCEGVTASKTGYTDDALYTLVTCARRGDTELICVALHCLTNEQKYISVNVLLDYCFENFRRVPIDGGNVAAAAVPVVDGGEVIGEVRVQMPGACYVLLHSALGESAVSVRRDVPGSLVVDSPFEPRAAVSISGAAALQHGGEVASLPFEVSGLDEVLAAAAIAKGEGARPPAAAAPALPWGWMAAGAVVLLLAGRILYVRRRRRLRRMRRAAALARLAVSGERRPPAPPRAALPYRAGGAAAPHGRPARAGTGAARSASAPYRAPPRGGAVPARRSGQAGYR